MSAETFTEFVQTFERILKNIRKIASSVMRKYGLRSVHTACILTLHHNPGGLTVSELSRECTVDKAMISRIVQELLRGNYIAPLPSDAEKSYNKRFILTQKSQEMMLELERVIHAYVTEAGQSIPPEDMQTFRQVSSELDRRIELISKTQL